MIERFKRYLAEEFLGVENTKEISDLKDELLANLVDKYEENRNLGYSEDKSFIESVKSIGDLKEIIKGEKVVIDDNGGDDFNEDNNFLYNKSSKYEYNLDKAIKKFISISLISLGIIFFGFIMFYLLTLTTYIEVIGFSVQMILVLLSGILFSIGLYNYHTVNDKTYKAFNNKNLMVNGLLTLRKFSIIIMSSGFLTVVATLPYVTVEPQTIFAQAILSFRWYLKVLPLFLLVGCIILKFIVERIDNHWLNKLSKVSNDNYNYSFSINKYLYIIVSSVFVYSLLNFIEPTIHFIILITGLLIYLVSLIKSNKGTGKFIKWVIVNQCFILLSFVLFLYMKLNYQDRLIENFLGYTYLFSFLFSTLLFIVLFIIWLIKIKCLLIKEMLYSITIVSCFILAIVFFNLSNHNNLSLISYVYLLFLGGFIGVRLLFGRSLEI